MVFLSRFLLSAFRANNSRCWRYLLQDLSSTLSFKHACRMAWLSEEVTFFSTNIFFTCALGRILSTSLGAKRGSSTGRYFPGEDGSRAGNGDRVMGMPPVQPSSSHSSQVGSHPVLKVVLSLLHMGNTKCPSWTRVKRQKGRKTDKYTSNVQMARTVGDVFGLSVLFTSSR